MNKGLSAYTTLSHNGIASKIGAGETGEFFFG
jgi:hypothetical protein